jgi:hypothetical protein
MPVTLESKSIKEQLIQALKTLSGLQTDPKFLQLIKCLEDPAVIIPKNKYTLDLLKFTYLLVCQYPQILADSDSQPLRKLCKEAVKKILTQIPSDNITLKSTAHKS